MEFDELTNEYIIQHYLIIDFTQIHYGIFFNEQFRLIYHKCKDLYNVGT